MQIIMRNKKRNEKEVVVSQFIINTYLVFIHGSQLPKPLAFPEDESNGSSSLQYLVSPS